VRRHDDARDAGLARERSRVDGPGTAVGDQGEFAQVVAALHRDEPERSLHVGVGHLDHRVGRVDEREAEAALDRLERPLGARAIELDRAAVDPLRVQIAEDQVRVAHGGLGAAQAVASRAGNGAGAPRPDLERAGGVDPGDRAAARADRLDGDRGEPDRIVAELSLARGLGHAVGDEAHVGGRAAHIEGERTR
jgi:hypothetical protein